MSGHIIPSSQKIPGTSLTIATVISAWRKLANWLLARTLLVVSCSYSHEAVEKYL